MANKNKKIGGGGFHHVAIRCANWEASIKFYEDVLGCVEKVRWGEGEGRIVLLDTGDGNYVELFANGTKDPKPESQIVHYALRTEHIDAAMDRVRASGAKIIHEPKTVNLANAKPGPTTIRVSFFEGPDGEIIEFFESETL